MPDVVLFVIRKKAGIEDFHVNNKKKEETKGYTNEIHILDVSLVNAVSYTISQCYLFDDVISDL